MSYVEKNLIAGETVVYTTRLHWVVLIRPIVLGLLFGVPGLVLLARSIASLGDKNGTSGPMAVGGFVLLIVAGACVGRGILNRNATEMAVTNKRLIVKVGVASRRTLELLLSKVESIGVEESVTGRILGYGTVVVRGTGGTPEPFDRMAQPIEFRKQVQQQIENSQEKSR
jgi:PH (Pleckstrin Homology) domain-containing protein